MEDLSNWEILYQSLESSRKEADTLLEIRLSEVQKKLRNGPKGSPSVDFDHGCYRSGIAPTYDMGGEDE